MNTPENRAATPSAPGNTVGGTAHQPEYGRIVRPEYGAMASDFPAGYDPYPYGKPDHAGDSPQGRDAHRGDAGGGAYAPAGSERQQARSAPSTQASPGRTWPMATGPDDDARDRSGRPRRLFHGVDLDDPMQNPLYGHWDSYAVIAFVFALSSIPVFPAIMGGVAMWRTRTFRMKGFGLALAAVILNVIVTAVDAWMMLNGVSAAELMQWMQGQSPTSGGQGSGSLTT